MADARIKAVITAEDRASRTLQGFGNNVGGIGQKFTRVAKVAAVAFTAAAVSAATFAVKAAADFEQSRIAFETMLGSADEARKLLKQLSEFAAKTPFDLPQVEAGAKQLLAMGASAEDVIPELKMLGDVSAGLSVPMDRLILNFGQVRTQGKLTGRELRDFSIAGVPLLDELAKSLGKSKEEITEMVSAGEIGFPEVKKAFENMSGEGGKFFNLMDKQSKTFSGTLSNLRDNFIRAARAIVGISEEGDIEEGSLFAKLRNAAQSLLQWLDDNRQRIIDGFNNILEKISDVFDMLSPKVKELVGNLKEFWKEVLQPMIPVIAGGVVVALMLLLDVLNKLIPFVSDNKELVWGLVAAFIALKAAMALGGLFNSVASGLAKVGGAAGTATTAIGAKGAVAAGAGGVGLGLGGTLVAAVAVLGTQFFFMNKSAQAASEWLRKVAGFTDEAKDSANNAAPAFKTIVDLTNAEAEAKRVALDAMQQEKVLKAELVASNEAIKVKLQEVKLAQDAYNLATQQFGPNSLQASAAGEQLRIKQQELNGLYRDNFVKATDLSLATKDLSNKHADAALATGKLFDAQRALRGGLIGTRNVVATLGPTALAQVSGFVRLSGSIAGVLQAGKNLGPTLQPTFNHIQGQLNSIQNGIESTRLQGGSLNIQGGRQHGGPVTAGFPYLVGEKGPEIIVPKQSGTVIPNDKIRSSAGGSNISLNVNIGMFAGSAMERRKIAEILFNDLKDVAAKYGMSLSEKVARA